MNRLDSILKKITDSSKHELKSEKIFDKYIIAKEKLDINLHSLAQVLEKLNKEQLDNLNLEKNDD